MVGHGHQQLTLFLFTHNVQHAVKWLKQRILYDFIILFTILVISLLFLPNPTPALTISSEYNGIVAIQHQQGKHSGWGRH